MHQRSVNKLFLLVTMVDVTESPTEDDSLDNITQKVDEALIHPQYIHPGKFHYIIFKKLCVKYVEIS